MPCGADASACTLDEEVPEQLRPARGVYIDALYYYMVDYDLDGLIDVGSTTRIEALERQNRTTIAHVIEFFSRSTKRGDQFQANFQKMYDEGIQIALKYSANSCTNIQRDANGVSCCVACTSAVARWEFER